MRDDGCPNPALLELTEVEQLRKVPTILLLEFGFTYLPTVEQLRKVGRLVGRQAKPAPISLLDGSNVKANGAPAKRRRSGGRGS